MHWSSVQHIFQYVQGTKNIGILYAPTYGPAYTRTMAAHMPQHPTCNIQTSKGGHIYIG